MKIQLIRRYRGVLTDEQWLEEGAHDLPDDLAEYLVGNGHAVHVDDPLPPVTPEENSVYVRTEDDEPTAVYFDPVTDNVYTVEPDTDETTFIDTYGITDPKNAHETVILPPERETTTKRKQRGK